MGRVKLQIKRIENNSNRQVTFHKRRNGLIKKAYELSVLCDIDIVLIMFSPSGRLSHFSGRRRIEDVLERYVNLPKHDRAGTIDDTEHFIATLQKLKFENDLVTQISNQGCINSNLEDIQQEIAKLQLQLHMHEERLRLFEPDPMQITSVNEIEATEKLLMETLARVTERKKYLLGNHLSSYDTSTSGMQMYLQPQQEAMQNGFGHDVTHWVPDGAPNPAHQFYVPPDHILSLREHTLYNHTQQSTGGLEMDPQITGCHISSQDGLNLPAWHQAFTSTELLSALMPSNPCPYLLQHPYQMAADQVAHPPAMDGSLPEQMEASVSCSQMPMEDSSPCNATPATPAAAAASFECNSDQQVDAGPRDPLGP